MRWSAGGGSRWRGWVGEGDDPRGGGPVGWQRIQDEERAELELPNPFGLVVAKEDLMRAKPGEVEYDTWERG